MLYWGYGKENFVLYERFKACFARALPLHLSDIAVCCGNCFICGPFGKSGVFGGVEKSFSYSVGTVETQSYSRISFEFSREIERADVVVRLVTPGARRWKL